MTFGSLAVGARFLSAGVAFVKSATSMAKTVAGKTVYFNPATAVTV